MSKKKKGKSHTPPTKPRQTKIITTMGAAGSGTLQLWSSGRVRLVDDQGKDIAPVAVEITSFHPRESGKDKVITRGPGSPTNMHIDANRVLLPFASVLAVDTNTREIRGVRVSVSVLVRVMGIGESAITFLPLAAVELHDARESPERLGWHYAIRSIEENWPRPPELQRSPTANERRGIALVVDSHLGALPEINRRERPYFGAFMLPADMSLVYGSSDVGTAEFIANRAIATCNTLADQLLRQIEAAPQDQAGFETNPSLPFARFRKWDVTASRVG